MPVFNTIIDTTNQQQFYKMYMYNSNDNYAKSH